MEYAARPCCKKSCTKGFIIHFIIKECEKSQLDGVITLRIPPKDYSPQFWLPCKTKKVMTHGLVDSVF